MSDAGWPDSGWPEADREREQARILAEYERSVQRIRAEQDGWARARRLADDAYWSRVERLAGNYEYPEAK